MFLRGSFLILCLSAYSYQIYVEPVVVGISQQTANVWLAHKGDVPYQAALKVSLPHEQHMMTYCGAVIIAPSKLLTVAHCIMTNKMYMEHNENPGSRLMQVPEHILSNIYVVANNLNLFDSYSKIDSPEHGQWRTLQSAYLPANYKFPNSDIATLFTSKPFVFDNYVNSIPVASSHMEYHGTCLVSGYATFNNQVTDNALICAHLNIIPTSLCNKLHRRNMASFICTTSKLSAFGKADSGGTLVCSNTGDPNEKAEGVLVGLISGHRSHAGSFFTRVSSYNDLVKVSSSKLIHICNNHLVFVCLVIILIQDRFCLF